MTALLYLRNETGINPFIRWRSNQL